ncbi:(2Fe-2S)-binding protein [Streptomyces sp. NPDC001251]
MSRRRRWSGREARVDGAARTPGELAGARPGPVFEITVDGRALPALPGQTVAAALWAAGILAWRTTRAGGKPRGVFCGIGQCFDCLVTVNGVANRRACLVGVRPGDAIGTQEGEGRGELAV